MIPALTLFLVAWLATGAIVLPEWRRLLVLLAGAVCIWLISNSEGILTWY